MISIVRRSQFSLIPSIVEHSRKSVELKNFFRVFRSLGATAKLSSLLAKFGLKTKPFNGK